MLVETVAWIGEDFYGSVNVLAETERLQLNRKCTFEGRKF